MEWVDEGIVLGARRHGESSAIVELMTRSHGRHLGLVRGGSSSRMRPSLQPGNSVSAVWRARLDEHLGVFNLEVTQARTDLMLAHSHAAYGITHLAALVRLLPERDPHEDIYELVEDMLGAFDRPSDAAVRLVRFELALLAELGFGLDLSSCAASGATTELIYVSPKSGAAVSKKAGEDWRDRLLRLPAFLSGDVAEDATICDDDIRDAFRLTGLFLLRNVLEPRGQGHSDAREGFIANVTGMRVRAISG